MGQLITDHLAVDMASLAVACLVIAVTVGGTKDLHLVTVDLKDSTVDLLGLAVLADLSMEVEVVDGK